MLRWIVFLAGLVYLMDSLVQAHDVLALGNEHHAPKVIQEISNSSP